VLGDTRYLEAAQRAAAFLLAEMYDPQSGQLLRRFCTGEAAVQAFLDDYAFFTQALLDLFEAAPDTPLLERAIALSKRGLARFEDDQGGFFSTEPDAGDLLLRLKDDYDGAEPSGNSVATDVLLRLAALTGDASFRERGERSLRSFAPKIKAQPTMAPQMLVALGRWLAEPEQVIVRCAEIDAECRALVQQYAFKFVPNGVVLAVSDDTAKNLAALSSFLAGLERKGRMTIYECRNFACELPKVIA
jgi:uncharacterized protein YyaL (SSP411 family)